MHYSRSFKKMIMSTEQGLIGVLSVEAEAVNEDEEEEDNQKEKERKVIVAPFIELGRFHTKKINGIKELGDSTQLVTISEDQTLAIWEATSQNQVARILLHTKPTAMDVSKDGKVAFVGSEKGVLRVYDLSNRTMPRLIKNYRFYEN
jgi:WD40 repeat protein